MTRNFVRLIRNHELGPGQNTFAPHVTYDPGAGGGTTTIEFDTRRGQVVRALQLSGTVRNCAAAPCSWAVADVRRGARRAHGHQRFDAAARLYLRRARHGAAGDGGAARGDGPLHARGVAPIPTRASSTRPRRGQQLRFLSLPPQSGRQPRGRRQTADARRRRTSAVQHAPEPDDGRDVSGGAVLHRLFGLRAHQPNTTNGQGRVSAGGRAGGASRPSRRGWYGNGDIYFVSTSGGNAGAARYLVRRDRLANT